MKLNGKLSKMIAMMVTAVVLTACGGSGDEAPPAAPVVPGSATGVLVDAAVGGVSYTTSSGVTGTTAADGSYKYNPGDTVTFKLGGVTIGTVTATGIISPMEMSAGSAVRLQNLLVLLQSLDADGNPSNGISIPAGAAAAVAASVNLAGSTATFAADAGVQAAMTAGGIAGSPKSAAAANAHFLAQGLPMLSANIWVNQSIATGGQTHTVILRVDASGRFTQIEAGATEYDGQTPIAYSGVEAGTITVAGFSPLGYNITANIATDGNGQWGVSELQSCDRLRNIGEQLVTSDCEASRGLFSKMPNVAGGVVGAWAVTYLDEDQMVTKEYYYLANGSFVTASYFPECVEECRSEVREGSYSASGGTITVTEAGDEPAPGTYVMSTDGSQMTLALRGSRTRVLVRLSK